MMEQHDTTTLDGYLKAAKADFQTYFPGSPECPIAAHVGGAEMKDLKVPLAIFRVDGIEDAELQDHALVTFALDFFWDGADRHGGSSGGYRVVHEIWSWVYRRFLFHSSPMMEPAGFDPETGALQYTYRWQRLFKNDYEFHPLEVEGFLIREINIHVEAL